MNGGSGRGAERTPLAEVKPVGESGGGVANGAKRAGGIPLRGQEGQEGRRDSSADADAVSHGGPEDAGSVSEGGPPLALLEEVQGSSIADLSMLGAGGCSDSEEGEAARAEREGRVTSATPSRPLDEGGSHPSPSGSTDCVKSQGVHITSPQHAPASYRREQPQVRRLFTAVQVRGLPKESALSEMRRLLGDAVSGQQPGDSRDFEMGLFLLGHSSISKAAAQYKKTLEWRKKSQADAIRRAVRSGMPNSHFPREPSIVRVWPHCLNNLESFCKDGNPLGVSRIGLADLASLAASVSLQDFQCYMIHIFESRLYKMERMSLESGVLRQFVDIHDFTLKKGLIQTFGKHLEYFRWWLNVLAPNYPEQVRKIIFVNTPPFFSAFWMPARLLLEKRTRRKVLLVDHQKTAASVSKIVDRGQLPQFLGGDVQVLVEGGEEFEGRLLSGGGGLQSSDSGQLGSESGAGRRGRAGGSLWHVSHHSASGVSTSELRRSMLHHDSPPNALHSRSDTFELTPRSSELDPRSQPTDLVHQRALPSSAASHDPSAHEQRSEAGSMSSAGEHRGSAWSY